MMALTWIHQFVSHWLYLPNRPDLFVKGKAKNKLFGTKAFKSRCLALRVDFARNDPTSSIGFCTSPMGWCSLCTESLGDLFIGMSILFGILSYMTPLGGVSVALYILRWCQMFVGISYSTWKPLMASVWLYTPTIVTRFFGKLLYITAPGAVASVWLCTPPAGVTRVLSDNCIWQAPGAFRLGVYTPGGVFITALRWRQYRNVHFSGLACQFLLKYHICFLTAPGAIT